jgi:hypothetical protein
MSDAFLRPLNLHWCNLNIIVFFLQLKPIFSHEDCASFQSLLFVVSYFCLAYELIIVLPKSAQNFRAWQ